ncbi:hypothetical protein [Moorena sp. SIO3H5]|uniref:hypothetical protein n=1 Tax=Moorena sp. SIO3H5 TaxID=2607834 RepID=UPI0025CF03FD|nr:hypothetical protein [Moorena sp. SIO3H5]
MRKHSAISRQLLNKRGKHSNNAELGSSLEACGTNYLPVPQSTSSSVAIGQWLIADS